MPTSQTHEHEHEHDHSHSHEHQQAHQKEHAQQHDAKHTDSSAKNVTKEDRAFLTKHEDELSRTTMRARWVHSADEHEEHHGQTLATRAHEVIQRWAEERQATPATVESTEHYAEGPGVLRFNFPGYGGETLKEIGWDEWFKPFDARELVFLFQETQKAGNQSNFFRLDSPEREDA